MKILITGFSGFIGKYLIELLKQTTHELILLDISNGFDICDWEQIKHFVGLDAIIHLANLSFVPASYEQPKKFYESNYLSTLNMLELCRINHAKMIFFSSYVYGHPQYQPIDENHPIQAFNPYAQTKVICESLCEGYNRDFHIPVTIFRPFNIYGKGQNPDFPSSSETTLRATMMFSGTMIGSPLTSRTTWPNRFVCWRVVLVIVAEATSSFRPGSEGSLLEKISASRTS